MSTPHYVGSEIGRLRQVIVHRPGNELARVTPTTMDALLYDDVPWVEKAQTEHDEFVRVLRTEDVEVLYLHDLLAQALENTEAREFATVHTFDPRIYGVGLAASLMEYSESLDSVALADLLIEGLTKEELEAAQGEAPSSLVLATQQPESMTFKCLPNHLFTRDSSAWIYGGVSLHALNKRARRRETLNMAIIYGWHPEFAGSRRWSRGLEDAPAALEGGDIFVLGDGLVMVGLSERTTPQGAERLAADLFSAGQARQMIAVRVPKKRAYMHLDTLMTQVDRESFVAYPGMGNLETMNVTPASHGNLRVRTNSGDMWEVVAHAMGVPSVRVLSPDCSATEAEREQWHDAFNVLCLRPGVVVAYRHNLLANAYLRSSGITVLEIPGGQLGRGRGGPRCMSCPTLRDPVS